MPSEVRAADLEDVLAFVYRGWAQVPEERRAGVVAAARALEVIYRVTVQRQSVTNIWVFLFDRSKASRWRL